MSYEPEEDGRDWAGTRIDGSAQGPGRRGFGRGPREARKASQNAGFVNNNGPT